MLGLTSDEAAQVATSEGELLSGISQVQLQHADRRWEQMRGGRWTGHGMLLKIHCGAGHGRGRSCERLIILYGRKPFGRYCN